MSTQSNGTVKWYNPEKAYGFITAEDGQELFVHRNGIADGRPWLIDGQGVAFTVRQGQKGDEAAEVRVTEDVAEIPAARQRSYSNERGGGYGGNAYGGAGGYGGGTGEYGSNDGGYRSAAPRPPREVYSGVLPSGAVPAKVMRIDPSGRFLFAHVASIGDDVYVHSSLFAGLRVQPGDEIDVIVERSDRGLRARTIVR